MDSDSSQLQKLAIASQQPPSSTQGQSSQSANNLYAQVVPEKRSYVDDDAASVNHLNVYDEPGVALGQQFSGPPASKKRSSAQSARTGQACDRCKVRTAYSPARRQYTYKHRHRIERSNAILHRKDVSHAVRTIPNARRRTG
jgi:hypothetical protein